jgi:hypothetical protein
VLLTTFPENSYQHADRCPARAPEFKFLPVCTSSTLSRPAAVSVSFLVCSPSFADSWPQSYLLSILRVVLVQDHRRYRHPFFSFPFPFPFVSVVPSTSRNPISYLRHQVLPNRHLLLTLSLHLVPLAFLSANYRFRSSPSCSRSLRLRLPHHRLHPRARTLSPSPSPYPNTRPCIHSPRRHLSHLSHCCPLVNVPEPECTPPNLPMSPISSCADAVAEPELMTLPIPPSPASNDFVHAFMY